MYFVLLFLSLLTLDKSTFGDESPQAIILRTKVTAYQAPVSQVEERMSDVKAEQESSPGCAGFSSKSLLMQVPNYQV